MKKIIFICLVFLLAFTTNGCGGSEAAPAPRSTTVSPPPAPVNRAPSVTLPNDDAAATRGVSFSYDATQNGRTFSDPDNDNLSYTVTIDSADALGLTVDGGNIRGNPTGFGTVTFTITARDPAGGTATDTFSVIIGTRPEVKAANENQTTRIGAPFNYDASQNSETFSDLDGDALSYRVTFSPAGQGLTANNGVISGTASISGSITITITATDDDGFEATDSFDILVLPREKEQLFVTQEEDIINVFVKGSVETSNKYLRYQFQRHDKPASRSIGWGWRLLHEATLQSDESFIIGTRLMRGGENFMAVRESGKTDFMGGTNHGDQIDSRFALIIDGQEKVIDGRTRYIGETVEFEQVSRLFEVDNPTSNVTANVNTDFKMSYGVNLLNNRVEFTRPIELSGALLTMLSADRHENGDANGKSLTSVARWSPDFEPYDVSQAFHNAPATQSHTIQLSGSAGFTYEIKMIKGWDRDRRRSIVNSGVAYNKLYFSPIGNYPSAGPGLSVPAGHVIEVEAEYRLDTAN